MHSQQATYLESAGVTGCPLAKGWVSIMVFEIFGMEAQYL
jgi:hypothetical protein